MTWGYCLSVSLVLSQCVPESRLCRDSKWSHSPPGSACTTHQALSINPHHHHPPTVNLKCTNIFHLQGKQFNYGCARTHPIAFNRENNFNNKFYACKLPILSLPGLSLPPVSPELSLEHLSHSPCHPSPTCSSGFASSSCGSTQVRPCFQTYSRVLMNSFLFSPRQWGPGHPLHPPEPSVSRMLRGAPRQQKVWGIVFIWFYFQNSDGSYYSRSLVASETEWEFRNVWNFPVAHFNSFTSTFYYYFMTTLT